MMITKLNQEANKTTILNLWGELDKSGPLVPLLATADYEASQLLEREEG
jgi:hypothetical protein